MPHIIRLGLCLSLLFLPLAQAGAGTLGVGVTFSVGEATTIRAYYTDAHNVSSKKGKGPKSLPPGIAKNLARGKALPPGIAKQVLPAGLLQLLPPAPKGYERVYISGKVLLVEIATQVIHDVLEDVFLR
jgi:hypothetical protein